MSDAPPRNPNGIPRPPRPNPLRPLRRKPANPLVASSKKPTPKPNQPPPNASRPGAPNGSKQNINELRAQYGGWSEPPPPYPYNDIPIMTTKKALLDGIRYHMMKFAQAKLGDKPIDPTDQDEFARPVTLHRRDARQPAPGRTVKEEEPEQQPVDEQEAERLAQVKAEREAQRALDQAKIAPVTKDTNPKRPKKQKEEKTMFNRAPKTSAAKKESDLRYEEALPWHLEDVDGKNVWVGSYVAALSEANVAFMIDKSVFRMVPLEKCPHFERNNEDEETKESKDRIRREQLGANLFGEGDEQEVDRELQEQLREELERQKYGKTTKKALIKRDREDIYESDNSTDNPWSSSSEDSSDEDEDEAAKEEEKKDGEGKDSKDSKDGQGEGKDKDKAKASGTKGTTTPQGIPKQSEASKKGKSLKRAGSPALSESSGNESTRKKLKKTSVTAPGSRSGTPLPTTNTVRRPKIVAGSGSDGEATAGEMSDAAGLKKKIKIVGSSKGTPSVSRAGSPNPTQSVASSSATGGVIEPWEILEKVPADGIAIGDLIRPFQGRVGDGPGRMPKGEWIKLVKQLCDYGPDKRLRRRK
ncbi:Transcription initiation factor IIF subunit alpha-like protein [Cladobotryum mycophilum]|uniref:Transcription initiation factor IIF subunit alpha-like protein n=1 Tax=Cladobotryum mycophilum TaxID=491253 RepID=A0ABR0T118_9HYPO